MGGDSSVRLSEILDRVGLADEVEAVEVNDPDLFSVSNENGAWVVTAHRAFGTAECMKVTIGGAVYEIVVTDDMAFPGNGTAKTPYLIGTEKLWQDFEYVVNVENADYGDKYYKLTADISIETNDNTFIIVGESSDRSFRGHLDGDGHTLTFVYGGTVEGAAPFRYVNGATIENLKVAGTINDRNTYAAGIAGYVNGNTTLRNCTSSVTVNGSGRRTGNFGGLAGWVKGGATLAIRDCVFNGSMKGSVGFDCGGFVGHNSGTVNVTDGLCAPESIAIEDFFTPLYMTGAAPAR